MRAVDGVDFTVRRGECFGLLGPNGAGKTSTVRIVHGVSPPDSGTVRVFGLDVTQHASAVKRRLGVCHQEDTLDPDFSVLQNLVVWARYFSIPRSEAMGRALELLSFMELTEKRDVRILELSGGMKRRLTLARSLMNAPELLILDEPTTGLDPQARHQVWDRLSRLLREGTSILITTHYMEEAARLCDRLVIMDTGRIVAQGSPAGLVQQEIGRNVIEVSGYEEGLPGYAAEKGWHVEPHGDRLFIHVDAGEEVHRDLTARFRMANCWLRMATLEDVFLKLTGRALRD
ncbi:MAG TPA: ATP-binding cassette domain-containing protein [Candidatus Polarisedimenticolia bacterium]|nr:ATP-binding cassette domain-containing protein [Candidatus Polarisedimenticolia bacterium]